MASNACFTAFSAAASVPILHYYGLEDYTTAKKTLISALLLKGDKVGRRGVSEGYLSAEEADNPCAVSWREQPCAVSRKEQPCAVSRKEQLLSGQYLLRGRKMAYVNAAPDEKSTSAVLENLSARNSSAQAKFPLFRL